MVRRMDTKIRCKCLRQSIVLSGVTQERVAVALGIDPAQMSRILRGLRPMPDGFEERVLAALKRLAAAEQAAEEARERVLTDMDASA